jgi:hypothetical protein
MNIVFFGFLLGRTDMMVPTTTDFALYDQRGIKHGVYVSRHWYHLTNFDTGQVRALRPAGREFRLDDGTLLESVNETTFRNSRTGELLHRR